MLLQVCAGEAEPLDYLYLLESGALSASISLSEALPSGTLYQENLVVGAPHMYLVTTSLSPPPPAIPFHLKHRHLVRSQDLEQTSHHRRRPLGRDMPHPPHSRLDGLANHRAGIGGSNI